jgi:ubiquinone/menaquinone biosynthesis C-methylase UbiE
MPLTEHERQTLEKYDVSAKEWLDHSGGPDRPCFWQDELKEFVSRLGQTKLVIELGCGPATDGKYLSQSGEVVLSTDYSETMLALAKELNPLGSYAKMDMQDLHLPDNLFDGFWATACLLHLENPEKALDEIIRVSKNGAVGFITIKDGEGEEINPKTGYYFKYYHGLEFEGILYQNKFEVLATGTKAGSPGHDWLTYLVRVNK